MRRLGLDWTALPIHPLLAAAYPVVFLFAINAAEQVTLAPLWLPLAGGGRQPARSVTAAELGDARWKPKKARTAIDGAGSGKAFGIYQVLTSSAVPDFLS